MDTSDVVSGTVDLQPNLQQMHTRRLGMQTLPALYSMSECAEAGTAVFKDL